MSVIAQIKELATSIGITVNVIDDKPSKRKSSGVPAKYKTPNNPADQWIGRGLVPKWLKALINVGHNKDEFLIES